MWCPTCNRVFPDRETICPICGGTLTARATPQWGSSKKPGDLLENWPRDERGEYIPPTFLIHCSSLDMDDELLVNMLSAYGVPCLRQYPNDGDFGRLILGMAGSGVDIFVPVTMLEDARALLEGEPEENDEDVQ